MLSFTSVKLFKSIIDGFPSRKSARKIGIEAAMMVMALSATPHITSCTVLAIPGSDLTIGDGGRRRGPVLTSFLAETLDQRYFDERCCASTMGIGQLCVEG